MTEAEWLSCNDPRKMLAHLGAGLSERKMRLFAAACCRRSWRQLVEELRQSIETAELFADGKVGRRKRGTAFAAADRRALTARTSPSCVAYAVSLCSVKDIRLWVSTIWYQPIGGPIHQHSPTAALLREVVGSPFRRASVPARCLAWNDGLVAKLARGIYDERAFDRLPVLADALEEAGCADADVLSHLRSPGPHVRGCWALDAVLGKG